jgi:hypothetical protein
MFSQIIVNKLILSLNKALCFIFTTLFIVVITSFIVTHTYAETDNNMDKKVRNAVVNQLLILGGKSKPKEEISKDTEQDKQNTKKIASYSEQAVSTYHKKSIKQSEENKEKIVQIPTNTAKLSLKKTRTKKAEIVKNKESQKQLTPLVEVLSDKEIRVLMLDVMRSSKKNKLKTPSLRTIQPQLDSNTKATDKKTPLTNNAAIKPVEEEKPKDSQVITSKVTSKQKTTESEYQVIPVGRKQLGRNATETSNTDKNKKLTGWIYLGHFVENKWENQTLDIEQLPEVGKYYAIKATMVNMRTALPKKGVMGKAIKAIKNKDEVKILQLRGLGRNQNYYWAKVEQQKYN